MTRVTTNGRNLSKLPFVLKLTYSTGQAVEAAINQVLSLFLLYYLTMACGIPGALAGAAVALGIIVDAVLDPLIGSSSDACRSRLGRRLPFMLAGTPMCALFFVLAFSVPEGWSTMATFAWVATFSILLRISMATFSLTYQAAGAEITDDLNERAQLVASRWALGIIASIIATLVGFKVYLGGSGALLNREAYQALAITLALVVLVTGGISSWAVWKTRNRQHAAPADGHVSLGRLWAELRELFSNPTFRTVFSGALLLSIALGVHGALALHVQKYLWRLSPDEISILSTTPLLGLLVGAPLSGPLLKRLEKRTLLMAGFVGIAVVFALPISLRLLGLLNIHGTALITFLATFAFFSCIMISTGAISLGAMIADTADEHEHMFGVRREALLFASWSFASKCSAGVGTLVAGLVLQIVNLPKDLAANAVLPQATEGGVTLLALVQGPFAGALLIGSIITMAKYRLDRRKHAAILADLDLRRSQKPVAA